MAAQLPGDVDLAGIDGQGAGDQRDVIEAVRRPRLPAPPDPHAHTPRLLASPGLGLAPLPGHQTPYVENRPPCPTVSRGAVYERSPGGVNGVTPRDRGARAPRGCAGPPA